MSKRKPATARQKELRARKRRGKNSAPRGKRVARQASKALRPKADGAPAGLLQEARDPRKISLARVVKRRDMGDLTGLAKSIDDRGCLLQPIVITRDDELIAGQRRLAAWALSKFRHQPIPVHVVDVDSIIAGEYDENAQRKDFTPSETVELMEALLPVAKEKARARQAHGQTAPGKRKADQDAAEGSDALSQKGAAEDHLAHYLGRDRKTIAKAKDVVDAARENPEKFGKLLADMDKSGKVNGPWRRLTIMRQVADIAEKKASGKLDLPAGKYDRFVADVPWPHELDDPAPAARGRATRDYPTMSIDALIAMGPQIKRRFAKNVVFYFWTTNFHMESSYRILRAWGLDHFPTIATWVKDTIGKGQRLREQTEHCIVAIKGKPVWNLTNESTRIDGEVREDGRKPDAFYALIDRVSPAQRSLELFARRELPEGWEGYGDQVGKFTEVEHYDEAGLLTVLDAIERGEPITFNHNYHGWRGFFTGKRKFKLTKAGRLRLEELREDAAGREEMAALPAELDALTGDYRATLERRHAAVLASDRPALERETRRLDLLQSKANGGTHFGSATDESPAEQLRRASAAAIGEVPLWGQRGVFRLDIDGVPYIVSHGEHLELGAWAEDRTKPCISDTGFHSLSAGGGVSEEEDVIGLGRTVAAQAEALIRDEIANPVDWQSGRAKPRTKKNPLVLPRTCYRLPRSWDEALEHHGGPVSVDDDDRAKRSRERLANRAVEAGHTVSMTREYPGDGASPLSVATCQCGWQSKKPTSEPHEQDAAVEAHWREATKPARGKRKANEDVDARVKPAHDESVHAEAAE